MPHSSPDKQALNELTHQIIGCAYRVSNGLGAVFLEKVYENALAHEIRKAGIACVQQQRISVSYDNVIVGDYVADLVVDGCVLIELKAVDALEDVHTAQCINYLAATRLPICLLLNFGRPKLEIKRFAGRSFREG
jgi:GxxExxY protein